MTQRNFSEVQPPGGVSPKFLLNKLLSPPLEQRKNGENSRELILFI
jgi:hypothetical protein